MQFFVDHGVTPSNAIVCGNENGQNTFFCRSFYEVRSNSSVLVSTALMLKLLIGPVAYVCQSYGRYFQLTVLLKIMELWWLGLRRQSSSITATKFR